MPKSAVAVQDQQVKIECIVDSFPRAKLNYSLNGKELTNKDSSFKFESESKTGKNTFLIPKVVLASHLGVYTVKAANCAGMAECTFELNVLGI